ncbi:hypothetical protein BH23CHL5_BH23CHL5_26430 [soil metagenome]
MSIPDSVIAPFGQTQGEWLRCALHSHSTESDGWLSPEILRRYHALAGYDVLAITDHDQYTKEPSGQDKLTILGATEISLVAPKSRGPLHLLAIGISSMPEIDSEGTLGTACRAVLEVGGLPFAAHPASLFGGVEFSFQLPLLQLTQGSRSPLSGDQNRSN